MNTPVTPPETPSTPRGDELRSLLWKAEGELHAAAKHLEWFRVNDDAFSKRDLAKKWEQDIYTLCNEIREKASVTRPAQAALSEEAGRIEAAWREGFMEAADRHGNMPQYAEELCNSCWPESVTYAALTAAHRGGR